MLTLRRIRIFLSGLFFLLSLARLLAGNTLHAARVAETVQIIPSLLASTMGITLFWLAMTFLAGRIYCSTVCPLGTLQDIVIWLRNRVPKLRKPFSFKPGRNVRYHILIIYLICLIVGVLVVSLWLEPWNMMRNICAIFNPTADTAPWIELGLGMTTGIITGIVSAVFIVICALFTGRGFCNEICPIGSAMGALSNYTLYHIEIDPDKCINCMKCEDVCKSQCVKVVGRIVDNSRCVRCFDCLDVCPDNAIRLQIDNNRRSTPMITKADT